MGAGLVADPIAFGIPEGPRFQSDDAETGARQSLQQDSTCRSNADDAVINLLGHFDNGASEL